jgi:hypothetical protein
MSKLLSVAAYLKAILVVSSFAFARSDMLPVILISALFSLAQLNAKSIGQTVPRDAVRVRRAKIEAADFERAQPSLG